VFVYIIVGMESDRGKVAEKIETKAKACAPAGGIHEEKGQEKSRKDEKNSPVSPSKKRSRSEVEDSPDEAGGNVLSTSDEATLKLLKHVGK
jgi:hypothetical protein